MPSPEEINAGKIYIGDRDVTHTAPKDRDIAMVFQNYALYPHMTVADNMAFALKMAKVSPDERKKRVADAAKILGLEEFLERKPKALSGGQRQRVAMGRAIVRNPQVFCMDEPLSNLDAKMRVQTRTDIAKLQADLGVTTVYVTHDQVEAMTMGDRVAVLKDGILQQVDTPRRMYDHPNNVFVAGFIGSPAMNLLTIPLDGNTLKFGAGEVPVPREAAAEAGDRQVTALDAKVTLDDSSLFRHPDNAALRATKDEDPQEQMARERGLTYVKLDGNVGILGNGAGLVMSTLDVVAQAGGSPANFLDAGGGSKAEAITSAVEVILSNPNVTAVLFNIFGGITRCDEVAKGLIEAFAQIEPSVPFVVRLDGTNDKEGRALLAEADLPNVHTEATMLGAATKVVELAA